MKQLFALIVVWLVAGPAFGQARLISDPLNERVFEDVPVSGSLIVGALWSLPGIVEEVQPVLNNPGGAERVCLTVVTQNGRYVAVNEFSLIGGDSGELPYPSAYQSRFDEFESSISALARLSSCDDAANAAVMPIALDEGGAQDVVYLVVNGGRDSVIVSETIPCQSFGQDGRYAFDTVCAVPVSFIEAQEGQIEVAKIRFGRTILRQRLSVITGE